jgi:hypothetical protein
MYTKLKRKTPFVAMSLPIPMFNKLKKGSLARALGQSTIPISLRTYLGLSMSVFVASSIVEIVAPYKQVKVGCRVIKQVISMPFFFCCLTLDKITEPFEKMAFGQTIPMDVLNLMGTVPITPYIKIIDKIRGLEEQSQSAQSPCNLDSLTEETLKRYKELFPNLEPEDDMMSSLLSTKADFEKTMGSAAKSTKSDNIISIPAPIYKTGGKL